MTGNRRAGHGEESHGGANRLLVEGRDDENVVGQILLRHYPEGIGGFGFHFVGSRDEIGVRGVLKQLPIRARLDAIVGAIVDADGDPRARWQSIRDRLLAVGYRDLALDPARPGLIVPADPARGLARLGVWIMPDNLAAGALEDFLRTLASSDPLMARAERVVDDIVADGCARFDPATARSKAIVHSYLAWQAQPGQPYGLAVKARVFEVDHPLARSLVEWLVELFGAPPIRG